MGKNIILWLKKQQQSNKQNPNDQKQKRRLFLAGSRILDLQHSRLGTLSKDYDDPQKMGGEKPWGRGWLNMWVEFLKDFIKVQKEEGKFVVVGPRPL